MTSSSSLTTSTNLPLPDYDNLWIMEFICDICAPSIPFDGEQILSATFAENYRPQWVKGVQKYLGPEQQRLLFLQAAVLTIMQESEDAIHAWAKARAYEAHATTPSRQAKIIKSLDHVARNLNLTQVNKHSLIRKVCADLMEAVNFFYITHCQQELSADSKYELYRFYARRASEEILRLPALDQQSVLDHPPSPKSADALKNGNDSDQNRLGEVPLRDISSEEIRLQMERLTINTDPDHLPLDHDISPPPYAILSPPLPMQAHTPSDHHPLVISEVKLQLNNNDQIMEESHYGLMTTADNGQAPDSPESSGNDSHNNKDASMENVPPTQDHEASSLSST